METKRTIKSNVIAIVCDAIAAADERDTRVIPCRDVPIEWYHRETYRLSYPGRVAIKHLEDRGAKVIRARDCTNCPEGIHPNASVIVLPEPKHTVERMRRLLDAAVASEDYLRAARLRDLIAVTMEVRAGK
jgi:hypothetical protein